MAISTVAVVEAASPVVAAVWTVDSAPEAPLSVP